VKLSSKSTVCDAAIAVGSTLNQRGNTAVLTGGACVAIYTDGSYVSKDADFVIRGRVRQAALDEALGSLGFSRHGDRYVHPSIEFYVEFPPGPLAIGADLAITPVELSRGGNTALAISPTDSCRDRLAAFYDWQDRQSLELAVRIARHQQVDLELIRRWSETGGRLDEYQEFLKALRLARTARARKPERRS